MKKNYLAKKRIPRYSKKMGALGILLFCCTFLFGQIDVSGTVVDAAEDFGLPGVNVLVKGKSTGTTTDFDGNFNLRVEEGDVLVFSYTGYAQQEAIVSSDNSSINISLAPAAELLDEVVVVGYGAVVKKDLTGVVTKVGEEDFNKGVIASPDRLLVGKVSGLQISSDGAPGGQSKIRLRGGTSLTEGDASPLIVIDGVPIDNGDVASGRNPLSFVNAADVADITVLKDASAAAIYGSRGANGVIIITTKTGQSGKPRINYSGHYAISNFAGDPKILSTQNFRNAISAKAPQEINGLGSADTDWVSEITQASSSQQHNLSFSGGAKKINYFVSLNHQINNGVLLTSNNQNTNATVNLGTRLFNDKLKINLKSKTGFTKDRFAPNVLGAAYTFDPTRPVFDDQSQYGGYFQWDDPLAVNNPVSSIFLTDERGETLRTLNALEFDLQLPFLEGLSWRTNLSYDYVDGNKYKLENALLKDGETFQRGGKLFEEEIRNYTALLETYGVYKTKLGAKGNLEYTLGYSWQDFDRENRWVNGNMIEPDDSDIGFRSTMEIKPDSFLVHNRLISFFTRANYTYDDRYLLTLSLRRDGSSRFGDGNKWGLFPAAAVGWRILEEDFAKGLNNTFSNLKLRLSYGVTGNQEIEDFLFATFYSFGTSDAAYQFGNQFISTLRGTGVDPNIKWEGTSSLNLGVDFGVLNNRLSGALELYQKYTDDLLFTVATAAFTNLSDRILTNISEVQNRGVELSLDAYLVDKDDFDWNMAFNVAYNKTKITKVDNSDLPDFLGYETGGISGDIGQQIQIIKVGEPVGAFRTFRHLLDANGNPLPDSDNNDDGINDNLDMYEDINGDGIINENDLVVDKKAAPDWLMGLTSNITYKNFDLGFTLRSNIGNYVYNNVASSTGFFDRLSDRVTNNIDESAFVTNFKDKQLKSNYYIENASFLKLDNISLGYSFNNIELFKTLRVYLTAQNIFTLTGYSGLDPELPQFNGGIDNNIYPVSRTYLVGLNASF